MRWQAKGIGLLFILLLLLPIASQASRNKHKSLCQIPGFTCMRVKGGQTWESLFPDERERGIIMRINRTNSQLYRGIVIKVPDDLLFADVLDYAPFPRSIEAPEEKLI